MPPPDIPPSIQNPQKSRAELFLHACDERFGVVVAGPGDDRLKRLEEIAGGGVADGCAMSPSFSAARISSRMPIACCRPAHSASAAQQVFLGDHLQNRPDVLRHAAVHQHQTVLQVLRAWPARHRAGPRMLVVGQQAAAADAEFRIALLGRGAVDEFHARPDAAGILPAAARPAEPFAEDRPGRDQPAFVFLQRRR